MSTKALALGLAIALVLWILIGAIVIQWL